MNEAQPQPSAPNADKLLHPLAMIQEWRRGCSCADKGHPEQCQECTRALVDALEAKLQAGMQTRPEPSADMIEAGAQALVQWENGAVWPDSWGADAHRHRRDARKVWMAMQEAAAAMGDRKAQPVEWSARVERGRVWLAVEHQSFQLAYDPDDEPDCSRADQLEWMAGKLRQAVARVAGQGAAAEPAPERPENCGSGHCSCVECIIKDRTADLPNVAATAPDRIYLVIGEDCPPDEDFGTLDEVTWCADKIDENSIEYVRADCAARGGAA